MSLVSATSRRYQRHVAEKWGHVAGNNLSPLFEHSCDITSRTNWVTLIVIVLAAFSDDNAAIRLGTIRYNAYYALHSLFGTASHDNGAQKPELQQQCHISFKPIPGFQLI